MSEVASKSTAPSDFKPHVFGRFFLLQRLAIGGMAELYRARIQGASGFEKELVVKRILPSRSQDQGFIKMLVNEAKLTVQLTHNNITQIYECGAVDENYFISMEFVNGVSLKDMMASFARAGAVVSPEQAIFIVLQLLQGLDYAHKKTDAQGAPLRIVHCDVSPDNALISYEGEVKLLDFGIARAATGLSNYKEGMLMGKLGYVAPEQASVEQTWDHRVDIFAAGIILYELLTKQRPFPKATDVESLIASRKTKVLDPTVVNPRLPRELNPILARALAYDPDHRYPNARAFADALVDVLFPTPQSAIQDLLGKQMREVFADRVSRQRTARAHDALVMKVLQHNIAQGELIYEKPPDSRPGTPGPAGPARQPTTTGNQAPPLAESPADFLRSTPARGTPRREARTIRVGVPLRRAVIVGVMVAILAGVGFIAGEIYLRPGVLIVTSVPEGATLQVDGAAAGTTPAVIENVLLWQPHSLEISMAGYRTATSEIRPELGRLVRRFHLELDSTIGSVTVESEPSGAMVRWDGRAVGSTPISISDVQLDERHRVDLSLAGYELDQFVVLPDKNGARFQRKLVQRKKPPGGGTDK